MDIKSKVTYYEYQFNENEQKDSEVVSMISDLAYLKNFEIDDDSKYIINKLTHPKNHTINKKDITKLRTYLGKCRSYVAKTVRELEEEKEKETDFNKKAIGLLVLQLKSNFILISECINRLKSIKEEMYWFEG